MLQNAIYVDSFVHTCTKPLIAHSILFLDEHNLLQEEYNNSPCCIGEKALFQRRQVSHK